MTLRIAIVLLAMLLAAPTAFPADPSPQAPLDIRVVEMKHLKGETLSNLVRTLVYMLQPGNAMYDSNLNVVVLKGTPAQLSAVEAMLKKADVPGQNRKVDQQVQLRVHLVAALPEEGKDGPVSPEIASAVEQMRKTFPYRSYRGLETLLLQTKTEAGATLSGQWPLDSVRKDSYATYELGLERVTVTGETQALNVQDFRLTLRLPLVTDGGTQYANTSIRTNVTIQKGQKVVVGKLTGEQGKGAIFLVLVADIQ